MVEDDKKHFLDLQTKGQNLSKGLWFPTYDIQYNFIPEDYYNRCIYHYVADEDSLSYLIYDNFFFDGKVHYSTYFFSGNATNMIDVRGDEVHAILNNYKKYRGIELADNNAARSIALSRKLYREALKSYCGEQILAYQFTYFLRKEFSNILYADSKNKQLLGTIYKNINGRLRLYRSMTRYYKDRRYANQYYPDGFNVIKILCSNRTKMRSNYKLSDELGKLIGDLDNCILYGIHDIHLYENIK